MLKSLKIKLPSKRTCLPVVKGCITVKLTELFASKKSTLSFEVFPPKNTDGYESVSEAVEKIAALGPDYMSITYGAGGSNSAFSAAVASDVRKRCGVTPLAHLSCVTATRQSITEYVRILTGDGIENVLALRGDIPDGVDPSGFEFKHASDLVAMLKEISGLCVGGACYPEGHPESASLAQDIEAVRIKVAAGCDFLTTQMFFDNNVLYNYMFKLRDKGVNVPVVAGIMPITNAKSIKRICKLSGIVLPQRFRMIVDRYGDDPDAMKQAGIAYATEQIIDLYANGIKAVHVYVMNKPDVAAKIKENLSSIVK